jgi:hypothetical protein
MDPYRTVAITSERTDAASTSDDTAPVCAVLFSVGAARLVAAAISGNGGGVAPTLASAVCAFAVWAWLGQQLPTGVSRGAAARQSSA